MVCFWSSNVHFSCFSARPSERAPKVPIGQHEQWGRCVLLISPRFVNSTSICSYILISIPGSYLWVISNLYHGNLTMAMVPATIWPKDRGWWCLTRPELFRCDLIRGVRDNFTELNIVKHGIATRKLPWTLDIPCYTHQRGDTIIYFIFCGAFL